MGPVRKRARGGPPPQPVAAASAAVADSQSAGSFNLVGPLQRDVSFCVDLMHLVLQVLGKV